MMRCVAAALAAVVLAGGGQAELIADAIADFVAATQDGIGVGGAPVATGTPADAAQQGHSDGTGSGTWTYGRGSQGDGSAAGGGFPLLDQWTGSGWKQSSISEGNVSASFMAPGIGGFSADTMVYRRWDSNGSYTGETLKVRAVVTLSSSGATDGATLQLGSGGAGPGAVLFAPAILGVPQVFEYEIVDSPDAFVILGILPQGVGPINANNFFFDGFSTELTVSRVPEPASAMLLGLGAAMIGLRRRR